MAAALRSSAGSALAFSPRPTRISRSALKPCGPVEEGRLAGFALELLLLVEVARQPAGQVSRRLFVAEGETDGGAGLRRLSSSMR